MTGNDRHTTAERIILLSWTNVDLHILCISMIARSGMLPNKSTPAHIYSTCCSCKQ